MYVDPLLWLLTALWFQHSQMKPGFHHLLQCDWEIHCHLSSIVLKGSQAKPFSAFCAHLWAFLEPILHRTCDSLACENFIKNSDRNLWKFTRKFWNCEAPTFTNFLVNTLIKIMTHYRWPTTSFFIVNTGLPIFEHSTSLSYSSFTHYILAVNCT
jgi:hypothetical protein